MEKIEKWTESLMISMLSVFAPIKPMIVAILVLCLMDLILGIIAAKKQKAPITSSGLKRTVGKLFLYEIAMLVSYIAEMYLLDQVLPITKLIAGLIGTVELKSIFENLDIINGSSLFTSLVNKLVQAESDKLK